MNHQFSLSRLYSAYPRLLVYTTIFYFFKTAFWPLTFLFIPAYALLWILFFLNSRWEFGLKGFLKGFSMPVILLLIIAIAFFADGRFKDLFLWKEILRVILLFSLYYLAYWSAILNKQKFSSKFIRRSILTMALLIALLNLLKVIFSPSVLPDLLIRINISDGLAIALDNNFFSLFMIFGVIMIGRPLSIPNEKITKKRIYYVLLGLVFIVNIVLSGSRRGLFVLSGLMVFFIFKRLFYEISHFNKRRFLYNVIIFFLFACVFFASGLLIVKSIPKERITLLVNRYTSIIGLDDYDYLESLLWETKKSRSGQPIINGILIPASSFQENPEYWLSAKLGGAIQAVETTYGPGYHITRNEDRASFSFHYQGPKICYYAHHTYQLSFKIKFSQGSFNSFGLGWWVNDGGRGAQTSDLNKRFESIGNGWYQCFAEYTFIDNHIGINGFLNSIEQGADFLIADLSLRDMDYVDELPEYVYEIKKIRDIENWLNEVNPPVYDESNLINNGDFQDGMKYWTYNADSLTVILERENGKDCLRIRRSDGDGGYWSLLYIGRNVHFYANNEYQLSLKCKPVVPDRIPFLIGFWVDEGEGHVYNLKPEIVTLEDDWLDIKVKYRFKYDHDKVGFPINSQIDHSEFFITDLELINLSKKQPNYFFRDLNEGFTGRQAPFKARIERWSYAFDLWEEHYRWYHKLLGNGFKYFEWYGEKFYQSERYEWPHNPFITILLYSGILGLSIYFWFLIRVLRLYLKYYKRYSIFFIGFIVTFLFSLFSGGNPFDPPIMGFFVLFPFIIHFLHQTDAVSMD